MATRYWLSLSTNWGSASAWSGAAVPVSGDTVVFPETASLSPTTGLDQSGVSLHALHIANGCAIQVGSPGTPLKIHSSVCQFGGIGQMHVWYPTGASNTARIYCAAPSIDGKLTIYNAGDFHIWCGGGTLTLDSTIATVDALHVTAIGGGAASRVVLNAGTIVAAAWVSGGTLDVRGTITVLRSLTSGVVNVLDNGKITTMYYSGGVVNYESNVAPFFMVGGGGGVLDFTGRDRPLTITGEARIMPGGKLLYDPDLVTIAFKQLFGNIIGNGPVP